MMSGEQRIETSRGSVWSEIRNSDAQGMPVFFLHSNSISARSFDGLTARDELADRPLVLMDFPGHGRSPRSDDPEEDYSLLSFREVALAVLDALEIRTCVLFGWSMGGHVALEMLDHPAVTGAMICGTPPVSKEPEDVVAGFRQNDLGDLTYKPDFTEQEARAYARACVGRDDLVSAEIITDILACDPVFRGALGASLARGLLSDHRRIAETIDKPLCAINGADDPLVAAEFLETVAYARPWRETPFIIESAGHGPFLDQPEYVATLIRDFAEEAV